MIRVDSGGSHVLSSEVQKWIVEAHRLAIMNAKMTPNQARKAMNRFKMDHQRSKDQAAPWWKRFTG
ncbi:hypothetical protein ACLBV5_09760 [Brevundimonas sp. M1A4_2e]